MTNGPSPRLRRSPATVRSLVLKASRELFDERGYDQVSTRDIADRAGVTHAQVFRHFGTKVNLFVDAVYQPFSDFVADYIARWATFGHGSGTSARDTEVFVSGLYQLLLDNRKLLVTLADQVAGASPELPRRMASSLGEVFDRLQREVAVEVEVRGEATMDLAYSVRFTFALVYGVVVLDDVLFAADE